MTPTPGSRRWRNVPTKPLPLSSIRSTINSANASRPPRRPLREFLAKVRLYYEEKHPGWEELDQDAADVLRDLERIGRTTTVVETPPVEDTALFDALAEYDRLAGIAQNLESRAEVFRPGIPEAEEATKAHEAAYDKASEAWTRARDIPVTTQAGLFTKLQAAIRFTDNLGEDELYEAEWDAIKSDVRRITGEGTATRRPTVTTPAAASSASDPVAQIGRDLAQIWRQVWRNDDDQKSSEAHSSERNRQVRLDFSLADRREALETMAAEIQAGSLEGAMVQIMLAHAFGSATVPRERLTI